MLLILGHLFIFRNEQLRIPGIEVTVSYEDVIVDEESLARWNQTTAGNEAHTCPTRNREKTYSVCLHAALGGSLFVKDCTCGYPTLLWRLGKKILRKKP